MRWFPNEHRHTSPDRQEDRAGEQRQVQLSDPCRGALTRTSLVARGNRNGIRFTAGAVLLMRVLAIVAFLVSPALTSGAMLAAQAVDRTDMPGRGMLRLTFEPSIVAWDAQFVGAMRLPLGLPLTGDTVGSAHIPVVARVEQDVRTAGRLPGFIPRPGQGPLRVPPGRRSPPTTPRLGLTDRPAVGPTAARVRPRTAPRPP